MRNYWESREDMLTARPVHGYAHGGVIPKIYPADGGCAQVRSFSLNPPAK